MDVRIRLPELLKARGLTAYQLAKQSGGRISMSAAYRLVDPDVREAGVEFKTLAAIVDVLGLEDMNELFSRDDEAESTPSAKAPAKPARKAKPAAARAKPRTRTP